MLDGASITFAGWCRRLWVGEDESRGQAEGKESATAVSHAVGSMPSKLPGAMDLRRDSSAEGLQFLTSRRLPSENSRLRIGQHHGLRAGTDTMQCNLLPFCAHTCYVARQRVGTRFACQEAAPFRWKMRRGTQRAHLSRMCKGQ